MMGESTATCFLSSFSQPGSAALEANQGDPIHALSSSVSFGRYMTEPLAWEKWSTFSNNRYKEEAERYSRPGSVAEMKAYFEAHYKKKAADRAAALNEKQNSGSIKLVSESENSNFSVIDQDFVPKDTHVGTGQPDEEVAETENVIGVSLEVSRGRGAEDAEILNEENSFPADPVSTRNQQNLVEDINNSEQKEEETLIVKADGLQLADGEDVQNPVKYVEKIGIDAASEQNKLPINAAGMLSRSCTGVPKPPVPPKPSVSLQKMKQNNANVDRKENARVPKPPVPPKQQQNKHTNANLDQEGNAGVPKPPVPPKPPVLLQKKKHNNANLERKGNGADMTDRKRTMSDETKKPMYPTSEKTLNSRLVKTPVGNASKVSRGKPFRDSVEISPHAAATSQDRKVRQRSPLSQSTSNTGKEKAKSQSPKLKSPGARGTEARPPTVTRSLIFKSEERAAKRKEFFERLEEKAKLKTTEKEKLQEQTKVKARNDPERKSESSKTSSNVMKKVLDALPCLFTVGRKMPSKLQDNSCQPRMQTTTVPCSATASTKTTSKLQDNNSRSPWRHSTLTCSSSAGTETPSKLQDNNSRSPWRHSTLVCSSSVGSRTPSQLQDNNSRSPWRHSTVASSSSAGTKTPQLQDSNSRSRSTLACPSSAGTKTPSKLQDNNSRSPWRHSTLACSSSTGTKTQSQLQDNSSRSPWRHSTLACSSNTSTKTPSKLQDNISRSPRTHTPLPCSSNVDRKTPSKLQGYNSRSPRRHTSTILAANSSTLDRKTPSRVQDNNTRPPWRLTAKSNCSKETTEKTNRSPFHVARSVSKKSTHENSSPNIPLPRES